MLNIPPICVVKDVGNALSMSSLITVDPGSRSYNRAVANYRHECPQTTSPWECCRSTPTTTHVLEILEMTIGKGATLQQWAIEAHNLYECSLATEFFVDFVDQPDGWTKTICKLKTFPFWLKFDGLRLFTCVGTQSTSVADPRQYQRYSVVGYHRLASLDEAGTLRAFRSP